MSDWVEKIVRAITRRQSNLAKAASNALHTLHASDSAVPKIWRWRDQAGDPLMTYFCIVFVRAPPCMSTQNFKTSFSRSGDTRGSQNLKVGPRSVGHQDLRQTQCSLGPQECSLQTGSWSVQPFVHSEAELSRVTDWQPPRSSVTIVCIS